MEVVLDVEWLLMLKEHRNRLDDRKQPDRIEVEHDERTMMENEVPEEHVMMGFVDDVLVYVMNWSTMMMMMIHQQVEMFEFLY